MFTRPRRITSLPALVSSTRWFRSRKSNRSGRASRTNQQIQALEDRALLTTFTVTSAADGGAGTLRQAIEDANANPGADDIQFADDVTFIVITGIQMEITDDLTIQGPGADVLTISGNNNTTRMFLVGSTTEDIAVEFSGLTISDAGNGVTDLPGPAIGSSDDLTLRDVVIRDNNAGGAIGGSVAHAGGSLLIVGSTFRDNAGLQAGALVVQGTEADFKIINSTFSGNSSIESSGAISAFSPGSIVNSTITRNRADSTGGAMGSGGGLALGTASVQLHNTIIAGNFRGGTTPDDIQGLDLDELSSGNLIGDAGSSGGLVHGVNDNIVGNTGVGTIDTATVLSPFLFTNGGTTLTHALVDDSPAIDAGVNNEAVDENGDPLTTDQRGEVRIADSDGDSTEQVDIGAFEVGPPPSYTVTGGPLTVNESGTSQTFTIVLDAIPVSDVIFDITSDNPGEATATPSQVTFTAMDWDEPQTVTVTGVDDLIFDGDQSSVITISITDTSDPDWIDLDDVTIDVTTEDNDSSDVLITQSEGATRVNEGGSTDTFEVILNGAPASDVFVDISVSDSGESVVDLMSLTFTTTNWNIGQTVTVTGIDDAVIDGSQVNIITVATTVESDPDFQNLSKSLLATTEDDDVAGFTVTETDGSTSVQENIGSDTVDVVLHSQPLSNVIIDATILGEEAAVTPDSLTFTPDNWNTPQSVAISGIDEQLADDGSSDTLVFSVNSASDAAFTDVEDQSVSVSVINDDVASFTITQTAGTTIVSEAGLEDTFSVVLDAIPVTGAIFSVSVADPTELEVFPTTIRFTRRTWDIPMSVTVRGLEDSDVDGNTMSDITISVIDEHSHSGWADVADQSLIATNFDNDGAAFLDEGRVIVRGTDQDDTFLIADSADQLDVTVNGEDFSFPLPSVDKIQVTALAGNDVVNAASTGVRVFAQLGGGDDQFFGSSGNDTVQGGGGNDTMLGNGGADNLTAGSGADSVDGGAGPDRARGVNGRDIVIGGEGADSLSGGGGNDSLTAGDGDDEVGGGSGRDSIEGGEGNDTVLAGPGPDMVMGGDGDDVLNGENGPDTIMGGEGRDLILGGAGGDDIAGGAEEDILVAGSTTLTSAELGSILDEWASDRSYLQRVINVSGATGQSPDRLNTAYLVGPDQTEAQTTFDDGQVDTIAGDDSMDLFYAAAGDTLSDRLENEWLEML